MSKVYKKPQLTVSELSAALYKANKELEQKNKELYNIQQAQREMFSNISHDLRSPITAIRSAIEYIISLDSIDRDELQSMFKLLTTRIMSLEGLINDIFLMTRLDSNALVLDIQRVSIGAILEEYFFSCEEDVKYQKREMRLEVPEQFDYIVGIDPDKIIRVLDNLFTNAYKYTKDGDFISLGAQKREDQIVVWVEDSGIGIPQGLCNKVFDRTYKVSSARTPEAETGAGLGLSIAKMIIEKHGGKIWCESEECKGSTFYFQLPI